MPDVPAQPQPQVDFGRWWLEYGAQLRDIADEQLPILRAAAELGGIDIAENADLVNRVQSLIGELDRHVLIWPGDDGQLEPGGEL